MARKRHPPRFVTGRDHLWVVLPLDEHWDSYVRFVAEDGHPVVAELRVLPTLMDQPRDEWLAPTLEDGAWIPPAPSGGLTSRALRHVHLGRAVELAYEHLDRWLERERKRDKPLGSTFAREAVKAPRRPGSAGREDRFYAVVASLYVDALEHGSRRPVVDVAERLSKGRGGSYAPEYVRDVLHEARRRELLTRPPKGRAGGELTDKARTALDADKETE